MTSSNITTNQFVRIDQTPASIAERVTARIIDMVIAGIIGFTAMYFYFELDYETRNQLNYLFFFLIYCHSGCTTSSGKPSTKVSRQGNIS